MNYERRSFSVRVGPGNSTHPKAADLDEVYGRKRHSDKQLDAIAQACGASPGGWTKTVRETGLLEHVCEHGVGHPDPESAAHMGEGWGVHGCDGCCKRDDFPGKRHNEPTPDGSPEAAG